jgi:hypothetical protein
MFISVLASLIPVVIACGAPPDADDIGGDVDAREPDAMPDAPQPRVSTLGPTETTERTGFGEAMARSGDTLVVGATLAPQRVGAAYVFVRRAGGWEQQAKLTGDTGALAFAVQVAIDGDTIAVTERVRGATPNDGSPQRVRVFHRTGTTWGDVGVIAPTQPSDTFGFGLAVQGDTIFVGGDGATRAFRKDGAAWIERATLTPTGATPTFAYGWAIAVDGNRLAIGDHRAASGSNVTGAVYMFTKDGDAWQFQQAIVPDFGNILPHDIQFGSSLALEGDRVVISKQENCPTAAVYELTAWVWNQVATLDPHHNVCRDYLFPKLAMHGDRIALGASGIDNNEDLFDIEGAGYVFAKQGASWSAEPVATVRPTDALTAGASVMLTADELLVGAPASGKVFVLAL